MVEKGKTYSRLALLKEFFGDVRPIEMDEIKALGMPGIRELTAAIAEQTGAIIQQ